MGGIFTVVLGLWLTDDTDLMKVARKTAVARLEEKERAEAGEVNMAKE